MIINRGFKFKLKPTSMHREKFLCFAGAARWIFNRGLHQKKTTFEIIGKSPSYFEQNKELTVLKKQPETSWLEEVHSQVLQQKLKDLDRSFQHFFRRVKKGEAPGYPNFKKKGIGESFRFPQGVKLSGSQVFLPKIGWVKFRKSREVLGEIKEVTILQEGKAWFVSFSCQWQQNDPAVPPIDEERAIGIDVGLTRFATAASTKENHRTDIQNPRFLTKLLPHLRYLSRQLLRQVKRSKNSFKARQKLSKLHARIKNLRNDFVQKLSTEMIKNHDIFCIESLDRMSLLKESSRALSRSISDVGWRSFLHCLKYKAEERGKYLIEAGKCFPSSQICASCDHRQKMPLALREYHCPNCGIKNDRDYNSAIVLKAAGMSVLKACGAALTRGSAEVGILAL